MLSLLFRGVLHSNPMDYAWGANGLDAIITQVKLGFTTVSILLCGAAGGATGNKGTGMGKGPQCGVQVPWLRKRVDSVCCWAHLSLLLAWPVVFAVTESV